MSAGHFADILPQYDLNVCSQNARRSHDPDVPEPALQAEEICVKCTAYISVPAAAESDHKPVLARLAISMPVTDQVVIHHILQNGLLSVVILINSAILFTIGGIAPEAGAGVLGDQLARQ